MREVDDANAFESLTHPGPPSSFNSAVDRLVDPRDQIGRQWSGFGRGDAFGEFTAVLDAKHRRIDGERQRIAMRQQRRGDLEFGREAAEAGAARKVAHLGMIGG